jgi:hypothetical protein
MKNKKGAWLKRNFHSTPGAANWCRRKYRIHVSPVDADISSAFAIDITVSVWLSSRRQTLSPLMRTLVFLILSCVSVVGAETGVRWVTITETNDVTASIDTKEIFTRDGQTNLIRNTVIKAGVVQFRVHRFYHGGRPVGDFVALPDSSGFTSAAGSLYSVGFEFGTSKDVMSAVIATKNGIIMDAFTCTNGIFSPVQNAFITRANSAGSGGRPELEPVGAPPKDAGTNAFWRFQLRLRS